MSEPTRPIHQPRVDPDGSLVAHTVATPTSFKVRARMTVGSRKVIPVIFVPGIMGSNLRVRRDLKPGPKEALQPGQPAWRPPNGAIDAYREARKWSDRDPIQRQRILDAAILEVDDNGELDYPACAIDDAVMHERGWGEVHSSGVLQLLPNHLYPQPWLTIKTVRTVNKIDEARDLLELPAGNPYDFYRDMQSWYRMLDPALADPARKYGKSKNGIRQAILKCIDSAERFHTLFLTVRRANNEASKPYYHPNTYTFHGTDRSLKTYGQIRWVARESPNNPAALTRGSVRAGSLAAVAEDGSREVETEQGLRLRFKVWPQDDHGDETVPVRSGAGPESHVRQVFSGEGFRHQESFDAQDMLVLTRHLIVKIVQDVQ